MKHNSLADFTDKVTSTELFNISIKRITSVTLFGKVTVFPFVSVLKVPSHQIRVDLKWHGWTGLGVYKVHRW
jgi:hypothetical protein